MPWKDKERAKAYRAKYYQQNKKKLDSINIASRKKWMLENPEKSKAQSKKNYNYDTQKKYQESNKSQINNLARIRTEDLTDGYMRKQLRKAGYSAEDLKTNPSILEVHREIIRIKRELR